MPQDQGILALQAELELVGRARAGASERSTMGKGCRHHQASMAKGHI